RAGAEKAVGELRKAGFSAEQVGFAMREPHKAEVTEAAPGRPDVAVRGVVGGTAGSVAGGVLGVLLGTLVTAAVPGVGPVAAAGALVAVVGGAYAGGVLGGLAAAGVPEAEARYYQEQLEAGRALVTVRVDGRYSEALAILTDCGARDAAREATPAP